MVRDKNTIFAEANDEDTVFTEDSASLNGKLLAGNTGKRVMIVEVPDSIYRVSNAGYIGGLAIPNNGNLRLVINNSGILAWEDNT